MSNLRSERRCRPGVGKHAQRLFAALAALFLLLSSAWLQAQDSSSKKSSAESEADSVKMVEARAEFLRGTELAQRARWAEALAAFERSSKRWPHPVTTQNVGACYRAMGQYTRAQRAFLEALDLNERQGGNQIPQELLADIRSYLAEVEHLVARVTIDLKPANAAIAIDGRPLHQVESSNKRPVLLAGFLPAGAGTQPPAPVFDVVLDPGAHVMTLSRKGFADAVVNRTFSSGSHTTLRLELNLLPADLHIESDRKGAIVTVNGVDVGVAPVVVSRPAGTYEVRVKLEGYVTYTSRITVQPGEHPRVLARLQERRPALTERWWFWSGVAAVVAGAAVTTYFATRPEPERPALSGGGLGWTLQLDR